MRLLLCALACVACVAALAPGAPKDLTGDELHTDELQQIAEFAIGKINEQRGANGNRLMLIRVEKATQQLVAGLKYTLSLVVGESSQCKADGAEVTRACFPLVHHSGAQWDVSVLVQAWNKESPMQLLSSARVANAHLHDHEHHHWSHQKWQGHKHHWGKDLDDGGMDGGSRSLEKDDLEHKEVVDAAKLAIEALNKESNALFRSVLSRVVSGTVQVVAGAKYTLLIEVGESVCRNDGTPKEEHECMLAANAEKKGFSITVLYHPWQQQKYTLLSKATPAEIPAEPEKPEQPDGLDAEPHMLDMMPLTEAHTDNVILPDETTLGSSDPADESTISKCVDRIKHLPVWAFPLIGIALGIAVALIAKLLICCCASRKQTLSIRVDGVVPLPGQHGTKKGTTKFQRLSDRDHEEVAL